MSAPVRVSSLIKHAGTLLQEISPKRIVLSGPSGFLGQRVISSILKVHQHRIKQGIKPGELVLLSSSPGRLMSNLSKKYGEAAMKTIR